MYRKIDTEEKSFKKIAT